MSSVQRTLVPLKGRRTLWACHSLSRRRTRDWLVFLPESGSDFRCGDRGELQELIGRRMSPRFHFLVINKPGVHEGRIDRVMFEDSFRRERRIEDALTAMWTVLPADARVHLVGYSEGAYLVPQVGRREPRLRTMCLIGGGTRGWLKEELNNATSAERPAYRRKIREILSQPKSRRRWNGFSYATWCSYRGDHTLRALRSVPVPTLAILGARDRVIDLKTTIVDLVLVGERRPIQVHVFGDCGHHFSKHWRQVRLVLGRFLADRPSRS